MVNKFLGLFLQVIFCILIIVFFFNLKMDYNDISHCKMITDDVIKKSYLNDVINLNEIPEGFYLWQDSVDLNILYQKALELNELTYEELYKNFKFHIKDKPWIKFLITLDSQLIFTSSGLIGVDSNYSNIEVLETIANKIRTKINETKKIKIKNNDDISTDNIAAAIYNAILFKMTISKPKECSEIIQQFKELPVNLKNLLDNGIIKDIKINNKHRGIYIEFFVPETFKNVRIAMIVKNSGEVVKLFVLSNKKTQFVSGDVRDSKFLNLFSGFLINDISPLNETLLKDGNVKPYNFCLKYKVIKLISDVSILIKNYISKIKDE